MSQKSLSDIPAEHLAVRPQDAVFYFPETRDVYAHWYKFQDRKWYVSTRTTDKWDELDEDDAPYLEDMIFLPYPEIDWQPETQFVGTVSSTQRRINNGTVEIYVRQDKRWRSSPMPIEEVITHASIVPLSIFKRKNSSSKTENDVDNWL